MLLKCGVRSVCGSEFLVEFVVIYILDEISDLELPRPRCPTTQIPYSHSSTPCARLSKAYITLVARRAIHIASRRRRAVFPVIAGTDFGVGAPEPPDVVRFPRLRFRPD